MAEKQNKPDPDKKVPNASEEPSSDELSIFAAEYEEDSRTLRWAFGIALAFHAVFFFIQLPKLTQAEPPEPEEKKVYVVQQVRFKPPPPKQKQELPEPKKKKVPIPDPTPDEPEPIRPPDEVQPDLDVPDTDVIFDIPEGPPPDEPEGPIQVGGDVQAPVKVHHPQPRYTELARKARIEGIVIVQAVINKQGQVTDAEVLKGLPMGLDQEALNAIRTWKFEPATLNGKPVDVYYNLTVKFSLQ